MHRGQACLGGFSLSGILRIQEPERRRIERFLVLQCALPGGLVCETGRICVRRWACLCVARGFYVRNGAVGSCGQEICSSSQCLVRGSCDFAETWSVRYIFRAVVVLCEASMCGMGRSFVGLPGWVAVLVCGMGRGPVLRLFVWFVCVRDGAVCASDQDCRSGSMCGIGRVDLSANS